MTEAKVFIYRQTVKKPTAILQGRSDNLGEDGTEDIKRLPKLN